MALKIIKFSLSRTAQTRDHSHLSWKEQSNETPHQETLTRLEGINSKVYRTDQQGAIRFKRLEKLGNRKCSIGKINIIIRLPAKQYMVE